MINKILWLLLLAAVMATLIVIGSSLGRENTDDIQPLKFHNSRLFSEVLSTITMAKIFHEYSDMIVKLVHSNNGRLLNIQIDAYEFFDTVFGLQRKHILKSDNGLAL
eukprot:scaffold6103_cov116-Cylindrotheca_fusiformis.AAC.2